MSPEPEATSPDPDLSGFDPGAYPEPQHPELSLPKLSEENFESISGSELHLQGPAFFNNYELSWLDFNFRVLHEAFNPDNPLLEQARFIGIVCSNLDEFVQKRVGGLKRQIEAGMNDPAIDGLTPTEQLKEIRKRVLKMIKEYRGCFFKRIVPGLAEHGIYFRKYDELKKKERKIAREYFIKQLQPILTPLIVDQAHPFPFISNKSRSFAIEIRDENTDERIFARLKVPDNRPRWFQIRHKDHLVVVNIDDIIREHLGELFPGARLHSAHIFRVTRNADIKRDEEEADDLLEMIEEELRERRFAEVVRLEIESDMPREVVNVLIDKMSVQPEDIYEMDGPVGLADCTEIAGIEGYPELHFKPWIPTLHPSFRHSVEEKMPDVFSLIRRGDILVHHPYHSFSSSVERFVKEAVADPSVVAIKQTLYRTSPDSSLMHALIRAVESGKQVAVLVELKARFDEQQNIDWAVKLEKAGVHVSYGLPGLKIHSKITMVVREEGNGLQRYAHIGTGNYHPGTANLYEDLGLFTCREDLAADVSDLFNYLTGYAPDQKYRKLLVAPHYLRKKIEHMIDYEIERQKNGKPARIIMKMNSLEDPHLIQKLYYASSQGVSVDLIVRGICRLRPGLKGLSENIRVHSIIGRFLEHSRIYYFRHADEHRYFIGSADVMHRNLDARVEAITPVESGQLKRYLRFVLQVHLKDNKQRWVLESDGTYRRVEVQEGESAVASHLVLMNHSSSYKDPVPSGVH